MTKPIFKVALISLTLFVAFAVLLISAFRTASVKYEFLPGTQGFLLDNNYSSIDYYLPYPGKVLPGTILWPIKAFRDKLWLIVNTSPTKEAELVLLFADKRLALSCVLVSNGNYDVGISTLTKAEKYLEEALLIGEQNTKLGYLTDDFFVNINKSALKHFELMQKIKEALPEDAKPIVSSLEKYPQKVYENSRNILLDRNIRPSNNPFNWQ